MTDNQILALNGLYRARHDEGVHMHYRTREALRNLDAIDRDGKITETGMAMFEAYAHGLRAVIYVFDTRMGVDWDVLRRDAWTGVRDMHDSASLHVALERLIKAHAIPTSVLVGITVKRLLQALQDAITHVKRQATAGIHEQDRDDSKQWQSDYADVIRLVRK